MTRHIRNPIKRHGDNPHDHFTMIPNELARDTELSLHAYRIAILIRTHTDGYEVSAASLAKMLGCHRDTVGKALHELTRARWLAIRTHKTAEGKRVFDEYHVHAARKFTEAEAAMWSESVVLPTRACGVGTPLPTEQATPCLSDGHPPAYGGGIKEDQPENQGENHSPSNGEIGTDDYPYCQECEDSRVNVCGLHFHERQHRYREPDDQAAAPLFSMPARVRANEKRCGKEGCGQPVTPSGHQCVMHLNYITAAAS